MLKVTLLSGFLVLAQIFSSGAVHAESSVAAAKADPDYMHYFYGGIGTPLGFETFELGYERQMSLDTSMRIQFSFIPDGLRSKAVKDSQSNLYCFEFDWLNYLSGKQKLEGWFLGPSIRLMDLHHDFSSDLSLPPFGPGAYASGLPPSPVSIDDYFLSIDCLGGYQWIFLPHVVLSTGLGLGIIAPLNDAQGYSDVSEPRQWIYWLTGATNLKINLAWIF